ncbi:MAG: hypothetical protein HGN29_01575 [Asgard group archaeon]|nr:hypothetical protein [Asgard group archaeon]
MKYYLYCSDAKIEMLFPQMNSWSKINFKLNLAFRNFFSLGLVVDAQKHKLRKAKKVSEYILKKCEVGTINNPKSYIQDTAKLKWGILSLEQSDRMVIFYLLSRKGKKSEQENYGDLVFILGGTPKHVTTEEPPMFDETRRSDLFNISVFFNRLDSFGPNDEIVNNLRAPVNQGAYHAIEWLSSRHLGQLVEQEIEFLAKKLYEDTQEIGSRKIKIVIGSPIYASLI